MTSNARAGDRVLGSLRSTEGKGIVRMEDHFDTDIDDLWSALTDPRRLASWLGEVEGDLRLGGEFRARFFASGWEGTGRVEVLIFVAALIALTGIIVSTYVGWIHIIPVNRTIKAGVADDTALVPLLRKWMQLNNIRWVTVTIMWGAAVWFIIAVGDFTSAV